MKKILVAGIILILICGISIASEFSPTGNMNLRGIYGLYNGTYLNATYLYQAGYAVLDSRNGSWVSSQVGNATALNVTLQAEILDRQTNDTKTYSNSSQGATAYSWGNYQSNKSLIVDSNYSWAANASLVNGNWSSDKSGYYNYSQTKEYYVEVNNSTDIQTKANLASANNGCAIIPGGFYNLSGMGEIVPRNNTCIKCIDYPIIYADGGTYAIHSVDSENITIEGCTFKGDYVGNSGRSYFDSSDYAKVKDCKFYDIAAPALSFANSDFFEASGNYINHTYYGIVVIGQYGKLIDNTIWYPRIDGIYLMDYSSDNIIQGNHIYNSTIRNGISVDFSEHTIITDNDVINNAWYGIYTEASNSTTISLNHAYGNGRQGILSKGDSIITDNYLYDNLGGVYLTHNTGISDCNGSIISGNRIYNSLGSAIVFANCSYSEVSGNTIYNYSYNYQGDDTMPAIKIVNAPVKYNRIENNIITDIGITATVGIYEGASSEISGNIYSENTIIGDRPYLLLGTNTTLTVPFKNRPETPTIYTNFEEGSGSTAYDSSGNGFNGTNTNITYVNGLFGKAIHMDGVIADDSAVSFGDSASFTPTNLTIIGWVKLDQLGVNNPIVFKYLGGAGSRDFYLNIDTSNKLEFNANNNTLGKTTTSVSTLTTGKWYFIAVRFIGSPISGSSLGSTTLFIDNQEKRTEIHNITHINNGGHSLRLGRDYGGNKVLNGSLDEFKFYNRSLTDEEIYAEFYLGQTLQGNGYLNRQVERIDNMNDTLVNLSSNVTNLYGNASLGNQSYVWTSANHTNWDWAYVWSNANHTNWDLVYTWANANHTLWDAKINSTQLDNGTIVRSGNTSWITGVTSLLYCALTGCNMTGTINAIDINSTTINTTGLNATNINSTTINATNLALGGVKVYNKTTTDSLYVDVGGDTMTGTLNVTNLNASGNITFKDESGQERHLANMATHIAEMQSDTLLDSSLSTITVDGISKLNYTLYAVNGVGEWNFNGTIYGGASAVSNASIILLNGSDDFPKKNYVHFYLSGGVPTLTTTEAYPSYNHIDVAEFELGAVNATHATIYGYNRVRYEINEFVKSVMMWYEAYGTLYQSGFTTTSNTTVLNISTGYWYANNLMPLYSTNNVSIADGFYYINSTGGFIQCTSLANLTQYNDGTAFSGVNERVNIVWGIIAVNVTGGIGVTQTKLVAVLPNYPGAGNTYQSVANAIQDNFGTLSFYPPNTMIKAGFVPIARTILRPNADVNEPFASGIYHRFIAGTVGTGGASPTPGTNDHATLDNLDYANSGHTGFVNTSMLDSVNSTAVNALSKTSNDGSVYNYSMNGTWTFKGENGVTNQSIIISPTKNCSSSTSVGGVVLIDNSLNTGAGLVVYSSQGANQNGHLISARINNADFDQSAIYATGNGASHTAILLYQGTSAASSALNIVSNNTLYTALSVSGNESAHGTIKISHTKPDGSDANAAALSINLKGNGSSPGTAAQGIYIYSEGNTTGNLISLNNNGGRVFYVDYLGNITATGYNKTNWDTCYSWGNYQSNKTLLVDTNYTWSVNASLNGLGNATAVNTTANIGALGFYNTSQSIANFVNRSLWTTIDNYPSACGAGTYATQIGDTLTCSAPVGYYNNVLNFTGANAAAMNFTTQTVTMGTIQAGANTSCTQTNNGTAWSICCGSPLSCDVIGN